MPICGWQTCQVNINQWPPFKKPHIKADINAGDVLSIVSGKNRDEMIKKWVKAVWASQVESRPELINFLGKVGFPIKNIKIK